MFGRKFAIGAGALVLLIGSAVSYRLATGHCPLADLCNCFHGQPARTTTPAN